MNRWGRREIVVGGAAFAACAPFVSARAAAPASRLNIGGAIKQGGLAICTAEGARNVSIDGQYVKVAEKGLFAFGFAYDQKKPSHISAAFADGTSQEADVTPAARHYEVQSITGLPPALVTPSPEDTARIQREHAMVADARKVNSDDTWFSEPLDWPAAGTVSGVFGSQRILNGIPGAPHFGVDVAAPVGAPVHAPASGTVLLAREFLLEGGYTLLDHGHGVFTGYMHQSRQMVKEGETVERGQEIGLVGKTGRATGPHLHWQMNWFQVRLDPSLSTRLPAPAKS